MSDAQLLTQIEQFVKEFTKLMDVEAEVSCALADSDNGEQKVLSINFEGNELGYMIGNQGAHLRGLQHVLSLMINRKFMSDSEESLYVNVDVSGYKQSKYEKIERMAMRLADDARILGEPVDMEPMGSAERRVVHMTLASYSDIRTESYGDGRDRFVRIIPTGAIAPSNMSQDEVDDLLDTPDISLGDDDGNSEE